MVYFFILIQMLLANQLPIPEEKFSAIVQHTAGKPHINEETVKKDIDFKDVIKFKNIIEVPKKSRLKVITQKRCIAVFYENSKIQSPEDKSSPWIILSGNARWICPEEKTERIVFKNAEIQVLNGEFLLSQNKLIPFKNKVLQDGKALQLQTVHIVKNDKWTISDEQPEGYDLWGIDKKFPYPAESSRHTAIAPDDPDEIRFFVNLIPGGISGFYHHEEERGMSDFNLETHGLRIGTNFPWKNKSIMIFLEYQESENSQNRQHDIGFPPQIGFKAIDVESFTFALGLRRNHIRSSSFYYYTGLTRQSLTFRFVDGPFMLYNGEIDYHWNVTAGGGLQKTFFAKNWLSLVIGIEARITQSLDQGNIHYFNPPMGEGGDPRSTATSYSGIIYLGPVFNF